MLDPVDFDARLHAVYHSANSLSATALQPWLEVTARHADPRPGWTVLDLGAGTGIFAVAFAESFGAHVVGVEPSAKMRDSAHRESGHPQVRYVHGSAEDIPMPDSSCDLAWLSRVIHHVSDRPACAKELARVVRPGGTVFIRTTFREHLGGTLYSFFPAALVADRTRFPSVGEVQADFLAAGFSFAALESIDEPMAPSLRAYAARLRARALSKFDFISDADFERGIAAMETAAVAIPPTPVTERYDLLILRRC